MKMTNQGLFFNKLVIGLGILLGFTMHIWMYIYGLPEEQIKIHAIINVIIFAYAGIYLWMIDFFKI